MKLNFHLPNFPGKEKLIAKTSRAGVTLAKHSPELLVGVGIVGFVGTVILASSETLKLEQILDEHQKTMDQINDISDDPNYEDYNKEDGTKDKLALTIQTAVSIGKLYAPAIALGLFSTACVIGGHHILLKRNAAISAAYMGLQKAYDEYRKRVQDEIGEEKEKELYLGIREKIEQIEKNGKVKEVKTKVPTDRPYLYSPYARIFDESSQWWVKDNASNLRFLRMTLAHCNDILRIRGHLFLNEVYDLLDIPRSKEGQVVGWIVGNRDSYVDFGLNDITREGLRDFINGYERSVWLDFNVDGIIYDLI